MNDSLSNKLFQRAIRSIPGGVNSPVRAFKSVGRTPLFIDHACGSKIYDVDGNEYIDYVGSWGPLILGHAHPVIVEAIIKAAEKGTSFGASTEAEVELAEMIINCVPSVEIVRLVNSGTEATMSAIRLARAYTERDKIIKFAGCYHGHADSFLIKAGSGMATLGVPSSSGVTKNTASDTIIAEYNDISSVKEIFTRYPDQIAAVIVEPIPANIGVILPDEGFLSELRKICTSNKSLLIFDEVITCFRVSLGGVQQLYNVIPDITTLGKIIGGGMPIGAYGGKREIMDMISPNGPVYQAGTLSGNPVAVAAGKATLNILSTYGIIDKLNQKSTDFFNRLKELLTRYGNKVSSNSIASMSTIFFTQTVVADYKTALSCDTSLYTIFFNKLLENGIYMAPSQFEAGFISSAHSDDDLDKTLLEIEKALNGIFNI